MKSNNPLGFEWNEFFWITKVMLPSWRKINLGESSQILFSPEGREEDALNNNEIALVEWIINNEKSIYDSLRTPKMVGFTIVLPTLRMIFDFS